MQQRAFNVHATRTQRANVPPAGDGEEDDNNKCKATATRAPQGKERNAGRTP
jgi:hypothetical protein